MSVHYKRPVLLIEFEENKAFSLEVCRFRLWLTARTDRYIQAVSEIAKAYAKPSAKYPPKKAGTSIESDRAPPSIQSKLVLLTLHFPRVRIIWSSSAYATTDIFSDLKMNNAEPDPSRAIAIGAEEDPDVGAGVNAAAEELLRCIPGVTVKNVKYVMSKVGSVRELCELGREEVQGILGVEPGNLCWNFIHRGEQTRRTGQGS
jgi:DNA excision repair protein ERCC-4